MLLVVETSRTPQDAIDLAEDRDRFKKLVTDLNILQPENGVAKSSSEAIEIVKKNWLSNNS